MKTVIGILFLIVLLIQPGTKAIDQIKNLKPPVVIFLCSESYSKYAFMTVIDSNKNYVDLHNDSTLKDIMERYHTAGDTIKTK